MFRIPFKNIAHESGLSVRTLYRVMNNDACVTDSTRRRAVRALNKFGYTCLDQRRSRTILINVARNATFRQPLALALLGAFSPECNIALSDSENEETAFLNAAATASVLISLEPIPAASMKKLRYVNPGCVVIHLLLGGGGDLAIDSNDFLGGKLAADHLFGHGHRHVAVVTPLNHPNYVDRMLAFQAQMRYRDPGVRIDVENDYHVGSEGPEEFWTRYFRRTRQLPSAIFCPLGGLCDHFPYYAEKFASLSVPGDISIVGYNRPEERGVHTLFQLDCVVFDLKKLIDCCKYYALNPPLSGIDGTVHTLIEPQLLIQGSVRNLKEETK